jgi:Nif-specific regulatory protein
MPSSAAFMDTPPLSANLAAVILAAARLIGKSLDLTVTIGGILKLLSDRLALKRGRVVQPDPVTGLLHITYSHGLRQQEILGGVYEIGEGVTGAVMATGDIALIPDVSKEPAYVGRISSLGHGKPPLAYIAVPILQNDACIGVLAVEREGLQPSEYAGDLYVLRIMAAMISQILRIHALISDQTGDLLRENRRLKRTESADDAAVHGIVGRSPALRRALDDAAKAASSEASVMLFGESGCGKERFARMIHLASPRRDKPFVCINCAAIPPHLLEAELFGHEKGAFTGAGALRKGKFEIASGGTLFLDEIGDMAPDLQAKLLRVLQERSVQRLGANEEIAVDVRLISATNKHLEDAVKTGDFRLDLYYRLNVIPIPLPPLRERRGDIELLALYFLARYNQQRHRNVLLTKEALLRLEGHDWPGNVRQLENLIERLVIMSDAESISAGEIERILGAETAITLDKLNREGPTAEAFKPYKKVNVEERIAIIEALRAAGGNKTHAARLLGMSIRQLYYRLDKLNIG